MTPYQQSQALMYAVACSQPEHRAFAFCPPGELTHIAAGVRLEQWLPDETVADVVAAIVADPEPQRAERYGFFSCEWAREP